MSGRSGAHRSLQTKDEALTTAPSSKDAPDRGEPGERRLRVGVYLSQTAHLVDYEPAMLPDLARIAEAAGVDDLYVGEHLVLSSHANRDRPPDANVRQFGGDWGQEPTQPWLEVTTSLAALAVCTERVRLIANAMIAPLRNPIASAKALATVDVLSRGRLVVNPVPSWQPDEYAAAGVDFKTRGRRLDDMLGAWDSLWGPSPSSYHSDTVNFDDIYAEPCPPGPTLWFGGQSLHPRLVRRLAKYGSGMVPMFILTDEDRSTLREAFAAEGRDLDELELVSGALPIFHAEDEAADIDNSFQLIDLMIGQGITSFFVGAGQFCRGVDEFPEFCDKLVARFDERR